MEFAIIRVHLLEILVSAEKQNYLCLFCPNSRNGLLRSVFQCTVLNHPCESTSEVKVFRVARGKASCEFKCHCVLCLCSEYRKQGSVFLLSRGKLALKNYLYLSIRHISHSFFHVMNSVIKQALLFNGNEGS